MDQLIGRAALLLLLSTLPSYSSNLCGSSCGSLPIRYPFGTGCGCGAPRFHPFLTCSVEANPEGQLLLTTHTGIYPVTSVSYSESTITITPARMSTCSSMYPSTPNVGLDPSGPFQLGPSLFILLSCPSPTFSLTYKGSSSTICDPTRSFLCSLVHTCPTVVSLGLPIFAPTSTCCVFSPAELGPRDELDLQGLHCAAYTSVVSFGSTPMDLRTWEYGVVLKYGEEKGYEEYGASAEVRAACEASGGVCGYVPPENYFVCVCSNGVNTSRNCNGQEKMPQEYWTQASGSRVSNVVISTLVSIFMHFLWVIFKG